MRAIDAHLQTREWGEATTYVDLALVVYGTDAPSRARLAAISRAVGRLVDQERARRRLSGRLTSPRGSDGLGSRTVCRETLVYRAAPTEAELEQARRMHEQTRRMHEQTRPMHEQAQRRRNEAAQARAASREALARFFRT